MLISIGLPVKELIILALISSHLTRSMEKEVEEEG